MQSKTYTIEIGGKTLSAMFSNLADQANGSVLIKHGETSILATAVMSKKKGTSPFFPLKVDYEERFYAAGRILGSQFVRREGRPTDEAILVSRVIDRTIRPLFDQRIRNEIQVIVTALSIDEHTDPDKLAVLGASLALATSTIPWNGPASCVRVGKTADGALIMNPTYAEREGTMLDSMICGKGGHINMIEAGAAEVSETDYVAALEFANAELKRLEDWQNMIVKELGKPKLTPEIWEGPEGMEALYKEKIASRLPAAVMCGVPGKDAIETLKDEWMDLFREMFPDEGLDPADELYENEVDRIIHEAAINENKRADNRPMQEVRPLYAQAGGFSEMHHGAGLFYRGGTHVLSVLTLGGPKDSQLLDNMEEEGRKYFMHHYNFPPFSSGEVGRVGGINRRAVGHGALAEKALSYILPARDLFPYTIRIVSESLASNGSTSMASVCASTLALMDAGVPIKRPAAGIAMGLMLEQKAKGKMQKADDELRYKVLTDIQGPEDHHGDMDFKVAGTREGITAIQMDVKVAGVPIAILAEALADARQARLHILDTIEQSIAAPRPGLRPSAPKIITRKIPTEKIGAVIGTGGKVIQGITRDTGADIDINDDGTVTIIGRGDAAAKADAMVEAIVHEYKAGERFEGPVVRILDFGAFVQIAPGTDGMVHVSELAPFRVNNVTDVVKIGDIVPVVVKEVDEKGRVNLSIKQADPQYAERKGVKAATGPAPMRSGLAPRSNDRGSSFGSRPRYPQQTANSKPQTATTQPTSPTALVSAPSSSEAKPADATSSTGEAKKGFLGGFFHKKNDSGSTPPPQA